MNLPFLINDDSLITGSDVKLISDVNEFYQSFLKHGENSKEVKVIPHKELKEELTYYGKEFVKVLNPIYESDDKKFRLSNVILLFDKSYIISVFKYDNKDSKTLFQENNNSTLNLEELTIHKISMHLNSTRIIRLYDRKDTIIIIKPNQYRYWLPSIAYRDADKSLVTLSNAGY